MFPVLNPATQDIVGDSEEEEDGAPNFDVPELENDLNLRTTKEIPESECYLQSVLDLRQEIVTGKHNRRHLLEASPAYLSPSLSAG